MFERISTHSCPLLYTIPLNIPPLQTQLLLCTYVMHVLAGRLANSHPYIKLAGHSQDATLIKFESNVLAVV